MLFGQTDRYNSFLRHSINNILGSDHRKSMDSARQMPSRLDWLKHAMRNDSAFVITQLYLQICGSFKLVYTLYFGFVYLMGVAPCQPALGYARSKPMREIPCIVFIMACKPPQAVCVNAACHSYSVHAYIKIKFRQALKLAMFSLMCSPRCSVVHSHHSL